MNGVNRRDAATWALYTGALLYTGYGGGSAEATTTAAVRSPPSPGPPPVAELPEWNQQPVWEFVAGSPATVNLLDTLPAGLHRGGRFSVNAGGAPLAAGMSLTAGGMLSVSSGTPVGATSGVVFQYSLP